MNRDFYRPLISDGLRKTLWCLLLIGLLVVSNGIGVVTEAASGDNLGVKSSQQRLAIPSYIYPGGAGLDLWQRMTDAAPTVGLVIINPASGPGIAVDANYAAQLTRSQAAGQTVIGYVHTSYGARALADVKADVDGFYAFYPSLDGIFLDEVSTDCTFVDEAPGGNGYYSELYDYIQAQTGRSFVVINPGVQTNECYVEVSDVILSFENTYATYTAGGYSQPAWVADYHPSRFWHLVHTTASAAEMRNALHLSRQRNAGWVYVTPDVMPNPWDDLPPESYWDNELLGARPVQAVWMYDFNDFDNSKRLGDLLSMNVNQLFMSIDAELVDPAATATYSPTYTSDLRDFVGLAHGLGISVHAMTLEDPVFTFPATHADGIDLIEHLLNYNAAFPDEALDGIHIDTEPHALDEWDEIPGETENQKWARRNGLIQDFASLLSQIRATIDASGQSPLFSAAIAWWFNEEAANGNLPAGDATALATHLDILVPMVFFEDTGNTTADIIGRVQDEIAEAPTIIGIHAEELGSGSYVDIQDTIIGLGEEFVPELNYQGTTVFHYALLDATRSRRDCAAETTLAGLNTCIRQGLPERDSDGYVVPDHLLNFVVPPGLAADWRGVIGQMLDGNCVPTVVLPPSLSGVYDLRTFTDTDNSTDYCLLLETLDADGNGDVDRGWGTVIVNPNAARELSVQVSHPWFDAETADQGIRVFRGVEARSFVMAGSHRYANPYCSRVQDFECAAGRLMSIPGSGAADEYPESDVAHNPDSLFQAATEALQSHYDAAGPSGNSLFLGEFTAIQFHGMAAGSCSAEIYLTYGLGPGPGTPTPGETLFQFKTRLLDVPAAASVQVPGDAPACGLNGSRNVQGRLLNGVAVHAVGGTEATAYTGRFIHVEQDPSFRDPQAWIDAITGPRALIAAPLILKEGSPGSFDASGSGAASTFGWDFGDGDVSDQAVASHSYADDDNFAVTLTVIDSLGISDVAATTVAVTNEPPELSVPAPAVTVDKASALTLAATFTDPGTGDTHIATIDWDDGAGPQPTTVTETDGAGDISASHTYAVPGSYTVTITVTDDDGDSDTATVTVTVRELVDLIFVIDLTGSMEDDIVEVKGRASEIVQDLENRNLNFRVAIVGYRDHPIAPYGNAGDFPYLDVLPFTGDEATIIGVINGLTVGGGADWEESVYSGLLRAINTDATTLGEWRLAAQKRIVLMGDAPPHDPEPVTGYTRQSVLDAIDLIEDESGVLGRAAMRATAVRRPVAIHGIIIGDDPPAHLAFSELAVATGGTTELAAQATNVVGAILATIEKFFNTPPVAVIGPLATATEGTAVVFDGTGSTDPQNGGLTYAWTFGDTATSSEETASHTYADNGVYTACLTVTSSAGLSDTACTLVTVGNVPPAVAASAGQPGSEGVEPVAVTATFSDPGFDNPATFEVSENPSPVVPSQESFTAVVEWGDGTETTLTEAELTWSSGSPGVLSTGALAAYHIYADDGSYEVTVCVTDDDGGSGCHTVTAIVENLPPEVTLDTGDAIPFGDGSAFLGRQGEAQTHSATATDPGADDLSFVWNGVPTATYPSDGTAPASASDTGTLLFATPGVYAVEVRVNDDEGGSNSDSLPKLITGNQTCSYGLGFWRQQFRDKKQVHYDRTTLEQMLAVVNYASGVFSEAVAADTIEAAAEVFAPGGSGKKPKPEDPSNMRAKALQHSLAAWLNFASGSVNWEEMITLNDETALPFSQLMASVEALLLDPTSVHADFVNAKNLAEAVNGSTACEDEDEPDPNPGKKPKDSEADGQPRLFLPTIVGPE